MAEFQILGQSISFSAPRMNYLHIEKMYREIADKAEKEFYKIYKSYFSIEKLIKSLEERVYSEIFGRILIIPSVDYMKGNKVYSVDDLSMDKACQPYYNEYFSEPYYLLIESDYEDIVEAKSDAKEYRNNRKAGRGKVVGYGFGISGQLKASAKAGAINAATGLGHSMFNAVGNAVSSAGASIKANALLHNKDNMDQLADGIKTIVYKVMEKVISIVEADTNIRYDRPSQADIDKAITIGNNVYNVTVEKDAIPACLAYVLSVIPDAQWIYEFIIEKYGDADKEVERMASEFGISVKSFKKEILDKKYSKLTASMTYDENEVLKIKDSITETCNYLGYSNAATYLQPVNMRLREIDKQLRTVEGVEYKTREMAKNVADDFKIFNKELSKYNFNELNLLDENKYSEIMDIFKSLPYKYKYFSHIASERLSQILKPFVERQQIKSDLLNPEEFCNVLYKYLYSQELYHNIGKHMHTIEFINDKNNKTSLDSKFGIPLIYYDFSAIGSFKKGLIFTTRVIAIYNLKDNIQSISFREIEDINITNDIFHIKSAKGDVVFKRPSTIPVKLVDEFLKITKYLFDIFKDFSEEDILNIEKYLYNTISVHIEKTESQTLAISDKKSKNISEDAGVVSDEITVISKAEAPLTTKSKAIAIILSLFLGGLGIDRFYLGYVGLGILKLITMGTFGIWTLIDFIFICIGIIKPKKGLYKEKSKINYTDEK